MSNNYLKMICRRTNTENLYPTRSWYLFFCKAYNWMIPRMTWNARFGWDTQSPIHIGLSPSIVKNMTFQWGHIFLEPTCNCAGTSWTKWQRRWVWDWSWVQSQSKRVCFASVGCARLHQKISRSFSHTAIFWECSFGRSQLRYPLKSTWHISPGLDDSLGPIRVESSVPEHICEWHLDESQSAHTPNEVIKLLWTHPMMEAIAIVGKMVVFAPYIVGIYWIYTLLKGFLGS